MDAEGDGWFSLWGCLSLGVGAALYCVGQQGSRGAKELLSVEKVQHLGDLAALVDSASKALPLIVSVTGRVHADKPIVAQRSGQLAAICEESLRQYFLKKSSETNTWQEDSAILHSTNEEVPWTLEDRTGRLQVLGARYGGGLNLSVAYEGFEEANRGVLQGGMDILQGLKMLGMRRVERILPLGTTLTAIGEVSRSQTGALQLRRPASGRPWHVSAKTKEELARRLGTFSKFFSRMAFGYALLGVSLLVTRWWKYRQCRKRRRELLEQMALVQGGQGELGDGTTRPEEKGTVSERELCVVCLENRYNAAFVGCGHLCCCVRCAIKLRQCPLCRRRIERTIQVYRP